MAMFSRAGSPCHNERIIHKVAKVPPNNYDSLLMSYNEHLKKHGADKIFLLALFALSLLIAYLIVRAKKVVVLGEPVEISEVGLSVRLPNGNGWQCDNQWELYEDTFLLSSVFSPSPGVNLADVLCTYRLASFRQSPRVWLEQYAAQFDASNPEYGTQQIEDKNLEWVYIKQARHLSGALAATMQLGHGRWLDIEITLAESEDDLALGIFEKIAKHIVIKDNELLEKGIEMVRQIKVEGLDKVLSERDEPDYYMVKDSGRHDVGFVVDILLEPVNMNEAEIQAAGFGYIRSPNKWEKATLFKSNPGLDEYVWESQTDQDRVVQITRGPLTIRGQGQNVRTSTRISVSNGTEISIHRLGPGSDELNQVESTELEARISEAAMPAAVIEALYVQMVNSNVDKIMVDVILSNGQVEPAVITLTRAPKDEPQVSHIVKIKYLGTNQEEETHFDSKMQTVKKILRQNGILVLEPTTLEDLARRFPERADYILQRSRAIKQGRL